MMKAELFECTVKAKQFSWKRIGAIPLAVALGSADIGECELEDGETVYITWGRNLTRKEQKWFYANTHFQPIVLGSHEGLAELILPYDLVKPLLYDLK